MKIIKASALIAGALMLTTAHAAERKPNVIVILTDDQGYGDMACHGNPWLKTPEIDRLHDESVRLTDFHVDPTCAPTRAALMTGRYSARTGVWLTYGSRHHLRRDEVTMADVFKQNGYETAIFGKWHLGDNYPFRPMDRGFDVSLIHGGGVVGETPDYWDNNYYDDFYFRNGKPSQVKGYCTDVWFNETMQFVEANNDRPFFAYLATNAPHKPLHVPQKYVKPYLGNMPKDRAAFYGMIANIDENIGRLRQKLNELSIDRDTILVFFNDNGTVAGTTLTDPNQDKWNGWQTGGFNAGMRGKKTSHYEGGHRAACFIRWPKGGLTGGRDLAGVTAHIDLLPTFIELCDLEFNDTDRFDGTSLAAALKGIGPVPERSLVVHDQGRFGEELGEGLLLKDKDYSVMHGSWRLAGDELYDLRTDPCEKKDIAAQQPEMAAQLRADYETWWAHISEKADQYCPFVINPAHQQTVLISSQNFLGSEAVYAQRSVRQGMSCDGWTMIDVEVPGTYRISLSRWPRESGLALNAEATPFPQDPSTHWMTNTKCKIMNIVKARLHVGEFDQTVSVNPSNHSVDFTVNLPVGEQRIQTWFTLANGEKISAYYTYIQPN